MANDFNNIDDLLRGLIEPNKPSLQNLFNERIAELGISETAAFELMEVNFRSMRNILSGSKRLVDIINLIKLAGFLKISKERAVDLFIYSIDKNFTIDDFSPEKLEFILKNFDLSSLKKSGLIENTKDLNHIEDRIKLRLGLKSIMEYQIPAIDVAFSAGSRKVDNNLNRALWIRGAIACFTEIDNPYPYDKEELIKYIPFIRQHTIDVENGLLAVSRELYKLGITVIYQAPLPKLQLRGATFCYNDRPCIVLTDYVGFYPTLWFALMHEIYHVLFDWEQIKVNKYHLTDDENKEASVVVREEMANNFARKYLFSKDKTEQVARYIQDKEYVESFALENHVHSSFAYVYYAVDFKDSDVKAWARAKSNSPKINRCIKPIDLPWVLERPVEIETQERLNKTYLSKS